jgi:hypothetical protein
MCDMIRRLLGRLLSNPPVEVLLGVDWSEPTDQALWLAHGGRTTEERDEIAELERAYRRPPATRRS